MEDKKELRAGIGSRLAIELLDASGRLEKMEVTLVPDRAADFSQGMLGESTPLGKVLINQPAGATLAYMMGDLRAVHIISITSTSEDIIESAAERRQKETEKTRRDIARQNAENFAASFSGKWGDYDPDGMASWDKDSKEKPEDKI